MTQFTLTRKITGDPRKFGATGNGSADDRAALLAIETDHDGVALAPGDYRVATDLTLSKSWNLVAGVMFVPDSGADIVFDGAFNAPPVQVFDESAGGTVSFGSNASLKEIFPEWWGLPRVGTFGAGDTTPSVARGHLFQAAVTPGTTVITNFDDGYDGQRILVKLNAATTVQHNANIVLAVGSDISAASDKILALVRFGGVWYQEGFATAIGSGGTPPPSGGSGTAYFQDYSLATLDGHAPDMAKFVGFFNPDEDYELRVRASADPGANGQTLKNEGNGGASRSWVFTQVPPTPTADVLVKCKAQTMHGANAGMGCMVRMSVDADGVSVNGWGARLHGAVSGGARVFSMWKYVHGAVVVQPEIDASADWADDTWMWIRLHVDSLSVKARYWADGDPEPTSWHAETQHDVDITTGWVGVYADQPAVEEEFALISVETNGGFAAMTGTPVAVTPAVPTISSPAFGPFDFEAETLGVQPAGWTERGVTATVNWLAADDAGNTVINSVKTSGGAAWLDLDAMSNASTVQEILGRMRQSTDPANGSGLALRLSDAGDAYCAAINVASVSIEEFAAGSFVGTIASNLFLHIATAWYWIRFRADGTTLMIKVWEEDEPEPKTWIRSATDGTLTAGSAGLYHFANDTAEFDDVSIATA